MRRIAQRRQEIGRVRIAASERMMRRIRIEYLQASRGVSSPVYRTGKAGDVLRGSTLLRLVAIQTAAVIVAFCALAGEGFGGFAADADTSLELLQNETTGELESIEIMSRIAFVSNRDDSDEIYVMNCDGTGIKRLTNGAPAKKYPSWSPRGNKIAFMSVLFSYWEIYLMNADGTEIRRLSMKSIDACHDLYPVWSPDGGTITFCRSFGSLEIYSMGIDDLNERRLFYGRSDRRDPAWSPDGKSLVYSSVQDGNFEVYLMNLDGARIKRLTDDPGEDRRPAWSPDGRKIAFQSNRDGYWAIYVMNRDGSGLEQLTHGPANDMEPAWSPDGRIVFCSDRDGNGEIYMMNADGTGQTNLTNNPAQDGSLSSQAVN